MFLVLSYTPISIFSLGWLSLSGSWLLPALQVPSVTRTTPTYWALLHSPWITKLVSPSVLRLLIPFSAPLSYWAVVLSRDLALFLHRHHMTEVLVEILTGYFPHFVDFLDPWSPFVTCSSGPLAPCMVQPPVIVAIHLSAPFHYWAVIFAGASGPFLQS